MPSIYIPSNEVLSVRAKLDILWEVQSLAPVDDLTVGVVSILSTEWWPSDLTLKHNRTQTPPITIIGIAMTSENLWCNVIRSTNCGVSHNSARLSPIVDNTTIANRQVDLVQADRVTVVWLVAGLALQQLLVVRVIVKPMESS